MAKLRDDAESPHVVVFTWPGHADQQVIDWVQHYNPAQAHPNILSTQIHPFYLPGQRIAIVLIYGAEEKDVRIFCKRFVRRGDVKVQAAKAIEWKLIQDYVKE